VSLRGFVIAENQLGNGRANGQMKKVHGDMYLFEYGARIGQRGVRLGWPVAKGEQYSFDHPPGSVRGSGGITGQRIPTCKLEHLIGRVRPIEHPSVSKGPRLLDHVMIAAT
jgi:hypothetical protein